MTTAADIQAAWFTKIWSASSIRAISTTVIARTISEISEAETSQFYDHSVGDINFFTFVVVRKPIRSIIAGGTLGSTEYQFDVKVSYYLPIDPQGLNHDIARNALETVDDLVRSALGKTWNGTVDFFEYTETKAPAEKAIDGTPAWETSQSYRASKIF